MDSGNAWRLQLRKLLLIAISLLVCVQEAQATFIPLTVRELDGSPSVTKVKTISVNGATLSDLNNGHVLMSFSGGANASGTAGAVQFSSGTTFSSDASNLFWDDTNNRLGIGTNNPVRAKTRINIASAAEQGLVLQATAGQTGNLLEIWDSANTLKRSINSNNEIVFHGVAHLEKALYFKEPGGREASIQTYTSSGGGQSSIFFQAEQVRFSNTIVLPSRVDGLSAGSTLIANSLGNLEFETGSGILLRGNSTNPASNDQSARLFVGTREIGSIPQKGIVVRAMNGQTNNLQEWQNSAGTVQALISSDGRIGTGATDFTIGGSNYQMRIGAGSNRPIYISSTNQDASIDFENTSAGGRRYNFGSTGPGSGAGAGFVVFDQTSYIGNLDSSTRFKIDPDGLIGIGIRSPIAQLDLRVSTSSTKGQVIRAAASQTANLTEWQNNAGTALTVVNNGGNLGVGISAPARKLHISQAMRLEPQSSPPASPSAGDLYVDSDGTQALCIYLNGDWVVAAGTGSCS
ncbi:MAG: hypothetical protein LW817_00330 [Candidatus Caenarcaniphilales bacterium]|nr:hypothetical protein [Candidatus Caenarcaniphilales bacterium]